MIDGSSCRHLALGEKFECLRFIFAILGSTICAGFVVLMAKASAAVSGRTRATRFRDIDRNLANISGIVANIASIVALISAMLIIITTVHALNI